MLKKKQWMNLFGIFIIVLLIVAINENQNIPQQTIVPSCFSNEDCKAPVKQGYCGVEGSCVVGKCVYKNTNCPEACEKAGDEDMDGLADCDDQDCWNSPYCHCSIMGYEDCRTNKCFCPEGTGPRWHITTIERYCACV